MNILESLVSNIEADQREALENNLYPAYEPISGDDIMRYDHGEI